jgi:N-acetyl-anhydromuramyl-L-alanine amidase AmpD
MMTALSLRWHRATSNRTRANPPPTALIGPPDPPGIVLHDSDSPAVYRGIPINAAQLEKIHAKDHPDWAITYEGKTYHIGYHYVILPDGKIEQGRPEHCPGAHARLYNDWIGVCIVGAFDAKRRRWWPSTPTLEQRQAVLTLCKELMAKYRIPPERVLRHCDVNWTKCPGSRFPYREIHDDLKAYAAAHPEIAPLVHREIPIIRPGPPDIKKAARPQNLRRP